jgi:hypothetical protein
LKLARNIAAVTCLAVGFSNTLYHLLFLGQIYVKHTGWVSYEQDPGHFIFNLIVLVVFLALVVAGVGLVIWFHDLPGQRPSRDILRRPPMPLVDETHLAVYEPPTPRPVAHVTMPVQQPPR